MIEDEGLKFMTLGFIEMPKSIFKIKFNFW